MALNKDAIKDRLEVKEFPVHAKYGDEEFDYTGVVLVIPNGLRWSSGRVTDATIGAVYDNVYGPGVHWDNKQEAEKWLSDNWDKLYLDSTRDGWVLVLPREDDLVEKIVKKGNKYQVTSEDGKKNLGGPYDTEEEAKKRLQQVHYFKNKDKKVNEGAEGNKDIKEDLASEIEKLHNNDYVWNMHNLDFTPLYTEIEKYLKPGESMDQTEEEKMESGHYWTLADVIRRMPKGQQQKIYDYMIAPLNKHTKDVLNINEDWEEETEVCEWCGDETPIYELHDTNYGHICDYCIQEIKSRGERIHVLESKERVLSGKPIEIHLTEGAEGKREPGYEYVIFEVTEKNVAPIVAIRSTRVEAAYLVSKLNSESGFQKDYNYEKVPKGKFHKGDDFWGPFDKDYNKLESLNENINFNTIFDSTGFEQEVLNKIPFSVAGIKSVSSKDLRKIKDYIASNFESIKERILELESDGVSKREMISILEDDILELGIRNNITTLAYIIYNGVKYINKRFENESLNEGAINEEYENGVMIPKKYLLANDYTEEEINELPDILWDKYTVNVKLTPKHIIITDNHHGYNVSYFMHYSDLSRFATEINESLNEDVKVTGDEDFTVKDVDVEHTGGNIWVAFGVYDNGLGFSLGSDLLFIYDEDARKEWDAEDQYEWENEHIVWDDYSEGLNENSNLFKSTLRQVFKKELNKHPKASPREVADDCDIFYSNEDIIKDLLNGERPGKARATLEALDELNIDKFIKIDDKELRDKANKLFDAGVITRNQLIFNITEDDINKLYKQWFKDNGKLRQHPKKLKESVSELDELLKLNLKPMELFAKAYDKFGTSSTSGDESEWYKLFKYANDYFEKHPIRLDDINNLEFLDYDEDEVELTDNEEMLPSEFNPAYGVIEDPFNDDLIVSSTEIPGVVYVTSNFEDGFTTMDNLKKYFNDENTFNYNVQEMAKEYEQDGMFDNLDESLSEDFWDEDSFFSREELDEFGEELQDVITPDSYENQFQDGGVTIYRVFFEPGNMLEVDWSYADYEETSKVKVDMRKIKKPSDLERYIPILKEKIESRIVDIDNELAGFDPDEEIIVGKLNNGNEIVVRYETTGYKVIVREPDGFENAWREFINPRNETRDILFNTSEEAVEFAKEKYGNRLKTESINEATNIKYPKLNSSTRDMVEIGDALTNSPNGEPKWVVSERWDAESPIKSTTITCVSVGDWRTVYGLPISKWYGTYIIKGPFVRDRENNKLIKKD